MVRPRLLILRHIAGRTYLSLPFFPLSGVRCCLQLFTASSAILLHPPLSPVFFFQSPSSPVFLTSLFTQSSHLSLGLPRLLLPCSRNSAALFGSLSSAILSTCPAHYNLLLTSLSVKLHCTPISSPVCSRYSCYFSDPYMVEQYKGEQVNSVHGLATLDTKKD